MQIRCRDSCCSGPPGSPDEPVSAPQYFWALGCLSLGTKAPEPEVGGGHPFQPSVQPAEGQARPVHPPRRARPMGGGTAPCGLGRAEEVRQVLFVDEDGGWASFPLSWGPSAPGAQSGREGQGRTGRRQSLRSLAGRLSCPDVIVVLIVGGSRLGAGGSWTPKQLLGRGRGQRRRLEVLVPLPGGGAGAIINGGP